jgi:phage tail-like protein
MALAVRLDPMVSYRFHVEIDGLLVAGFAEVSGISVETETEEYREGGINDYVHKFPKLSKYPNLVLKRGLTMSPVLWKWHNDVVKGKFKRKSGRILIFDPGGLSAAIWTFEDAYPVKWSGPDLKADGNALAIESIELVHNGIKKLF